ncbi:MAG: SH3 domain-containing protein [Myxococcales bacterium]|nr:SH3 domain-containing protein [Myxococcales bacterium]
MPARLREARRYLALLELEPGATLGQVKAAHRRLVQIWHPDRFEANVERRIAAEDKIKGINSAYTWLTTQRGVLERLEPDPAPARRVPAFRRRWISSAVLAAGATLLALAARDPTRPASGAAALGPAPRRAPGIQETLLFDRLLQEAVRNRPAYYVQAPRLNVRSRPGTHGEVVGSLDRGVRVRAVRRDSGWVEVARPGSGDSIGWVPAFDLDEKPPRTLR